MLTTGSRPGPGQPSEQRLTVTPRILFGAGVAFPLLATGPFLLFWNIASTTLGTYGTYFLVTVTELTCRARRPDWSWSPSHRRC